MTAGPAGGPVRGPRIGLTGPIGCGKSTIGGWLARRGAIVIDADTVAREVVEPGTPTLAAIAAAFGSDLLGPDGRLDRAALGRRVFADPEALRRLEAIVHPAVRPVILARAEAAEADGAVAVVIEAIRLVEGGLSALCDEVWLVTCDRRIQAARLAGRGMAAADAAQRIEAQTGMAERLAPAATRRIDTGGTRAETERQVDGAFSAARAALASRRGV